MYKPPLTFAHFVDLPENRAALLAVQEAAARLVSWGRHSCLPSVAADKNVCPTNAGNPLLLCGPPGTGKTHLVSALAAEVVRQRQDITMVHATAADFAPGAVECDVLIVEDLQHLPEVAIGSFTQMIDNCRACGQQMIFTANAGPQLLQNRHGKFPARLVNRLAGGMVVRLEAPGIDSRRALLRAFAGDMSISQEIIDWLAERLAQGGRQLVGAMAQVQMLARTHAFVDVEMVARLFQAQAEASEITVEKIAERVSGYFQVQPRELLSKQRHRHLMIPRQVSMYLARQMTGLSLQQIGAYFGGRDHTTVLHACRKVEHALSSDTQLSGAIRQLQTELC